MAPSWTGGMGQGCAPVFQPFGEPTSNIPLNTPSPGSKVREECTHLAGDGSFRREESSKSLVNSGLIYS